MNVLHLQPELNKTCGVTRTIYYLAKVRNVDSIVATLGGDNIDYFLKNGINVIKFSSLFYNKFLFPILIFEIVKIIRVNKIDIIHSHHRMFDIAARLASFFYNVKTAMSVHSIVYGNKRFSYKSEKIIAVSNSVKEHLINYFNVNKVKITVIYNFVNISMIKLNNDREQLREELSIADKFVFGFIGRIDIKEKGIDILLKAFEKVSQKKTNVFLIIVGNGKDKEFAENFISSKNLSAKIIDATENIWDYYNIIDVVILPSRVDPFPLVMLEAGIMKKVFIGSKVDGIAEFIMDNRNGLLFDKNNAGNLVEKMEFCLNSNNSIKRLGENLSLQVNNNFISETILPKYINFYNNLMSL